MKKINTKKVLCGYCKEYQLIDEIKLCAQRYHASKGNVETKVVKQASEPARAEVHTFSTAEERDAWIAENPGARVLTTSVRSVGQWSEEAGKYVSVVTRTYKACI